MWGGRLSSSGDHYVLLGVIVTNAHTMSARLCCVQSCAPHTPRKTTNITQYFFGTLSIILLDLFDKKTTFVTHSRGYMLKVVAPTHQATTTSTQDREPSVRHPSSWISPQDSIFKGNFVWLAYCTYWRQLAVKVILYIPHCAIRHRTQR